jgi:hypothetical protein
MFRLKRSRCGPAFRANGRGCTFDFPWPFASKSIAQRVWVQAAAVCTVDAGCVAAME